PLRVVVQRHVAALRRAGGTWNHHGQRAGRHDPVGDRLLHVLQGLAREQRALRVGVHEAGGDPDLQALPLSLRDRFAPAAQLGSGTGSEGLAFHRASYSACSNSRWKSAAVQGRGLVWWHMSATAISTRRGMCPARTPCAPNLPARPMRALRSFSHCTNSPPPPQTLHTCASSSNFLGTVSWFH